MRISQPNYGKVLERGTFMKEYQLERWSEGAPCGCPLSPGARGFAHPEPIGVTPLPCVNTMGQRPYYPSRMEMSYCTFGFGAIIRRDLRTLGLLLGELLYLRIWRDHSARSAHIIVTV